MYPSSNAEKWSINMQFAALQRVPLHGVERTFTVDDLRGVLFNRDPGRESNPTPKGGPPQIEATQQNRYLSRFETANIRNTSG